MTPEQTKMVVDNMRLAYFFAKHYDASRMEGEDFMQEAMLGLIDAAAEFDESKGKFSTYAPWHIRKRIMDAIHNRNEIVRVPRRREAKRCNSLDAEDRHGRTIADDLQDPGPGPDEILAQREQKTAVHECIERLRPRDALVIKCRHGVNTTRRHTLAEVGMMLGVTPERVRQVQEAAEEKLRVIMLNCATLREHGATDGRHKEPSQPTPRKT